MGWLNIPLDIMTITIAAIAIGIAVDDTIHFIHRFEDEFKFDHDYVQAMRRAHDGIGHAMYYTTLVIVIGFSILMLSNLVPTIYFGLLTVVIMINVLAADLLLLPKMLLMFKPYGKTKEIKKELDKYKAIPSTIEIEGETPLLKIGKPENWNFLLEGKDFEMKLDGKITWKI